MVLARTKMSQIWTFQNHTLLGCLKPGQMRCSDKICFDLMSLSLPGSVPFKIELGRLYLHRHSSFSMSGLYEKRASNRTQLVTGDNAHWELPEEDVKIAMRESPADIVIDKGIELHKVTFAYFL